MSATVTHGPTLVHLPSALRAGRTANSSGDGASAAPAAAARRFAASQQSRQAAIEAGVRIGLAADSERRYGRGGPAWYESAEDQAALRQVLAATGPVPWPSAETPVERIQDETTDRQGVPITAFEDYAPASAHAAAAAVPDYGSGAQPSAYVPMSISPTTLPHRPRQASPASSAMSARSSAVPPNPAKQGDFSQVRTDWLPPFAPRYWTIIKEVGDGSFGTVWLADWHSPLVVPNAGAAPGPSNRPEYRGKRIVAIKRMKKAFEGGWDECMQLKELKSLRQIPMHPNVIPLYDAFLLPTTRELNFVFECMEGNLYQLTKSRRGRPIASALFASIYFQIVSGLAHVHGNGFFHRDLKPENLLITTTGLADYPTSLIDPPPGATTEKDVVVIVKLADFGLAREIKSAPPYTEYVSTRWYRAPEVLLRARDYSAPVDIWALGCILVEILNLKPLFPGDSEVDQVFKICETLGDPTNDYGMEEDGNPRGGGVWRRGIKVATRVGFSFPTIPPRPFASLFDQSVVTPALIDSIHRMLRYDPAARIGSADLFEHDFFRETMRRYGPHIACHFPPGVNPYPDMQSPPTAQPMANGTANRTVSTLDLPLQRPTSNISNRSLPPSHASPLGRQPPPPFAQAPMHNQNHSRPELLPVVPAPPPPTGQSVSSAQAIHSGAGYGMASASVPTPAESVRSLAMSAASIIPAAPAVSPETHAPFPSAAPLAPIAPALSPAPTAPSAQRPADQDSIRSLPETVLSARIATLRTEMENPPVPAAPAQWVQVPTHAPSVAPSTIYAGSMYEGTARGRAPSVFSLPLQNGAAEPIPPVAGPSGFNTYRSQSPAPSSMFSQAITTSRMDDGMANPLKRAPSDASLSSMRLQTPPLSAGSDQLYINELSAFLPPDDSEGEEEEENPKHRARRVMLKKGSLRGAADPLHNYGDKDREGGEDGASIFSHSGVSFTSSMKGRLSERMPQIIEDTSRLYVSSPPNGRSAARSSGGFNRHKTRRRDGDDDVRSVLSIESGRSAPAWTFSVPGGRGRTFSISSKATSASDPERRQRADSDVLGPGDQPPARLQSVSSLPNARSRIPPMSNSSMPRLPSLTRRVPPSTGHSAYDPSFPPPLQGRGSLGSRRAEAARSPMQARSSRSGSRSRMASPIASRASAAQGSRAPLPALPPIQSFDRPPPNPHPILQRQGTSASIASFRSVPGTMPSYFAAPDRPTAPAVPSASATTYHLPYLPVMDLDPPGPPSQVVPLSAGLNSSFPPPQGSTLPPIAEPPLPMRTPEHLPPG